MAPSRVPPSVLAALRLISMEAACLPDACAPDSAPASDTDTPVQPPTICLSPVEIAPCLSDMPEPHVGPCLKPMMDPYPYGEGAPEPPPKFLPPREAPEPRACLSELPQEPGEVAPTKPAEEPTEEERPVRKCLSFHPIDFEAKRAVPPGEEAREAVLERGVLPADVASLLRNKRGV